MRHKLAAFGPLVWLATATILITSAWSSVSSTTTRVEHDFHAISSEIPQSQSFLGLETDSMLQEVARVNKNTNNSNTNNSNDNKNNNTIRVASQTSETAKAIEANSTIKGKCKLEDSINGINSI